MNKLKPYVICLGIIIAGLVLASLLDIVLAALMPRFYSTAAFIVIFGVAGIIVSLLCFVTATDLGNKPGMKLKWPIIIFLACTGIIFFTLLAKFEGGEYRAAFQSYGVTLALSSFIFVKEKNNEQRI